MKTCPKCGRQGFEPKIDEVDIGVGILEHYLGGECDECGFVATCNWCGSHECEPHQEWCRELDAS